MIAIIDYGMGNIHSVQKALESFGAVTKVTNNPEVIKDCQKMVLPGVGAFKDALVELEKRSLIEAIKLHVNDKKPFLGICLGMQLLFENSEESKGVDGFGLLKGQVKKFVVNQGLKVPHMGWNQLETNKSECPLLKGIANNSFVYFCHSYYPEAREEKVIGATTNYGVKFTSIVWKDNIYGLQFHPEKSQKIGLKMLENFVEL